MRCGERTNETDTSTYETSYGDDGELVADVSATIHDKVATVLVVRWIQLKETRSVRVRYSFEGGDFAATPPRPGEVGAHEEVLLGIPEKTTVHFFIEQEGASTGATSGEDAGMPDGGIGNTVFEAVTGALPKSIPKPTVLWYDPASAGPEPWLLGSVENTPSRDGYYVGPFWIFIMDRQGRIVWYYSDRGDNPCMAFPRVAPDGSHLYIEKRKFYDGYSYTPKLLQMTLDYKQMEEISIPDFDDCYDVTDDGDILFNKWSKSDTSGLFELHLDGSTSFIWDCTAWAFAVGATGIDANFCYSNTVNWSRVTNTVLMSFPYINSAVEIDRQTGKLVSVWGDVTGSFAFSPDTWSFEFNHFANITPDGTLLISTHAPGHGETETPGEHRFAEFEIDRENRRLQEKWVFGEGVDDWPMFKGEAQRTAFGN